MLLPDGTFDTGGITKGWLKWAGTKGAQFFVVIPGKQCCVGRFSEKLPGTLRLIDDTGKKFDSLLLQQ